MSSLQYIEEAVRRKHKLLAILFDPEEDSPLYADSIRQRVQAADVVLVGGSTSGADTGKRTEALVRQLKALTQVPVLLFPGQIDQFTPFADALLYLSVLTSRDVRILTEEPIAAARRIRESGIETIPMGYILVDGGSPSSVARASASNPIPQQDVRQIADTALAACLMGKKLVYLEAGSGAAKPVAEPVIQAVRELLNIPLLVGGGIRTPEQMANAFRAGADVVVIGNHLEQHFDQALSFAQYKQLHFNE